MHTFARHSIIFVIYKAQTRTSNEPISDPLSHDHCSILKTIIKFTFVFERNVVCYTYTRNILLSRGGT